MSGNHIITYRNMQTKNPCSRERLNNENSNLLVKYIRISGKKLFPGIYRAHSKHKVYFPLRTGIWNVCFYGHSESTNIGVGTCDLSWRVFRSFVNVDKHKPMIRWSGWSFPLLPPLFVKHLMRQKTFVPFRVALKTLSGLLDCWWTRTADSKISWSQIFRMVFAIRFDHTDRLVCCRWLSHSSIFSSNDQ